MTAQQTFRYIQQDGTLTIDGLRLFRAMEARLDALEGKMALIAAIVAPVGGATVDAEARTAIAAILAGAG